MSNADLSKIKFDFKFEVMRSIKSKILRVTSETGIIPADTELKGIYLQYAADRGVTVVYTPILV